MIYFFGLFGIILVIALVIWSIVSSSILPVLLIPWLLVGGILLLILLIGYLYDRKRKKNIVHHDVFGDILYEDFAWETQNAISFSLWDKTYQIMFTIKTKSENDPCSEIQISAYYDCINALNTKRTEIEDMIIKFCMEEWEMQDKQLVISDFDPDYIHIEENGQCILYESGSLCPFHDSRIAFLITPLFDIMSDVDYLHGYYQ